MRVLDGKSRKLSAITSCESKNNNFPRGSVTVTLLNYAKVPKCSLIREEQKESLGSCIILRQKQFKRKQMLKRHEIHKK